jgi:hypothetical protein
VIDSPLEVRPDVSGGPRRVAEPAEEREPPRLAQAGGAVGRETTHHRRARRVAAAVGAWVTVLLLLPTEHFVDFARERTGRDGFLNVGHIRLQNSVLQDRVVGVTGHEQDFHLRS